MDILDKIIWAESHGDPNAGAATSSAVGLGQFTKKTWLDMMSRYRPDLTQGKSRDEILAMRTDPDLSRQMVGALVGEGTAALRRAGVPVTEGSTYLSHFAGSGKAIRLMKADPNAPVESILDAKAIDANPFLKGKTAGDVIAWADRKMATAAAPKSKAGLPPAPQQRLDAPLANDARRPQPRFPQGGAQTQAAEPSKAPRPDARYLVRVPSPANNASGGRAPMLPPNAVPSVAPASFDDRFGDWPSSPQASAPAQPRTTPPNAQPSSDGGNTSFGIYKYPTENQLGFDPGALSGSPNATASPDARYLVRMPSPQTDAPPLPYQPGAPQPAGPPPGGAAGQTRPDLAIPPPIWGFPDQSKDDNGGGSDWLLQLLGNIGLR